ncbi:ABC transporter permease [Enterococcus sp. LJL90]
MANFFYQVAINFKRIVFRNLRFFLFNLALPIGFYLLFTKVMTSGMPQEMLKTWNADYLVSMVLYSSLLSSVLTVSSTLLNDQEDSFDLFIELSPIPRWRYYASMMLVFWSLNMLGVVALGIVGILVNQVALSLTTWLILLLAVPLTAIPLIFLGIMISLMGTSNVVNLLSNLIVFPMAIASGLWWPLSIMPDWLRTIGEKLPTYFSSQLISGFIHQEPFDWSNLWGLLAWSVIGLAGIGVTLYYRKAKELQTI